MKSFGRLLLWSCLFVMLLLTFDLSMIYIPSQSRGFNQIRNIYLDFRFQLLGLVTGKPSNGVDTFLRNRLSGQAAKPEPGQKNGPRFFYVDGSGEIHFVTDLNNIPSRYRSQAQKLER